MHVMYLGGIRPGVEIEATGELAEYGQPVEVSAELGEALLLSSEWLEVDDVDVEALLASSESQQADDGEDFIPLSSDRPSALDEIVAISEELGLYDDTADEDLADEADDV